MPPHCYVWAISWRKGSAIINLTIGESKYASLMLGFNAEIPEGVKAYVAASVSDGYVHLSEIEGNVIAASTPVLLKAEVAGDYAFAYTEESAAEVGDNLLEGVLYSKSVSMSSDYNYYVFDEGECVWLPAVAIEGMEDCFSATANTAYLQVPTTMAESYSNLLISSVTASGTCGENLTWELTPEGKLTIEGTGAMTNYEPHSAPWFSYKDDIKTVTINPGVTTIGKYAIGDCSNLTTVTIPEGVTSIGLQAFQYCYKLTSVTLSDGLKTIDWGAFAECHELPSIDIPEGVTTIGNYAFTHCYKLSSVTIPESVTSIGIYAFRNTAITSVVIPANISSLSQGTFENCPNLASITCKAETPPSVGHSETFYNVNRSIPVYVPVSAVAAYKEANYWKEFTNFLPMGTFGDNLTWMLTAEGELIIEGTGVMPDYTQPWSDYKQSIKTITVGEGITVLGSAAFSGCGKCTEVNLPNSLTDIRYEAFFVCSSLPSITLPKNVRNVGGRVFCDCGSLASVTLNEGLESLGGETFRACGALKSIEIPSSMKEIAGAFYECKHLASVTIPEGVQKIASGAFCYCNDMASLTLPASLTSIGGNAFKQCVKLAYIEARATTPPTIEGSDAFTEVDKNVPVYVPASSVEAYKAADYWSLFANIQPMIIASGTCGENLTWKYIDGGKLLIEGTGEMFDYSNNSAAPWQNYKGSIKSIDIKDGVTSVGSWAFSQCPILTDVSIAESVTSIGGDAFRECSILEEITLPKGLTELGTGVFLYCSALKSITVPEGVTIIGSDTFEFCPQLSSITFPSGLTEIGPWALKGAYSLTSITCKAATPPSLGNEAFSGVSNAITVYVPASSVEAYKTANGWSQFANIQPMIIASGAYNENITWKYIDGGALVIEGTGVIPDYTQPWSDYKQSIKSITVGEGITVLGSAAFSGCGKCTEVNLPNSLTDIRYEAFFVCSSLPSITLPKNVRNVGGRVFCDCGSLASVTLNEGLESLGGETFRACGALKSIEIPSSMKEIAGAFYECKHLASVTIPEGVQKIASGAFCYCNDMASLTLPASLTSIGGNAFKQCVKLAYIEARATTPPTIEGSDAFTEVDKNVPVYVPASSVEAYKAADYWSLFANILPMGICGDELAWKLTAEGELIIEGTGAMTSAPWSTYAESIKKVTIKEGVTSIYDRAFEGCNQVETMTIPNSVVEVGTSAFNDCTGELFLNSMPVPAEGAMMMGGAFKSCGFTKVIVGEGVTEIKDMAFFYSRNLAEVELPETIERIGDMAFDNCVNFTTFVCKGMTPPTCIGELFYNVNKELTLFVPITAIANYQVAAQWKDFDYIVGTAMCGETLTGELWPDGKLIVKGEGAITTAPWEAYGEQIKELVLEEGVTGIADKSFVGFDNLLSITSYAENPPVCSAEAFNGVEKTTPVYVVPSKLEDYSVSEGWCEFIYLTSNDSRILLDSYVDYSHEEDESFEEIAYVRTFNNTNWQALYVPFEIPVTEEFLSDFEVADLNDIRQYDRDDDGVKDETAVEAFKVTSGTLKANYPYLIRAKEAGEKTIIVADATLYATKENSYDCSSLHEKYTFTPTYSRIEGFALAGCYALSGGVWQPIDEEEALGAFRFYLMIESRDGNLQVARTIRLRIIGGANDDDTTRIDTAESTANGRQSAVVYDLQGRRVVNPTKGIYIVNGKKLMY